MACISPFWGLFLRFFSSPIIPGLCDFARLGSFNILKNICPPIFARPKIFFEKKKSTIFKKKSENPKNNSIFFWTKKWKFWRVLPIRSCVLDVYRRPQNAYAAFIKFSKKSGRVSKFLRRDLEIWERVLWNFKLLKLAVLFLRGTSVNRFTVHKRFQCILFCVESDFMRSGGGHERSLTTHGTPSSAQERPRVAQERPQERPGAILERPRRVHHACMATTVRRWTRISGHGQSWKISASPPKF